MKNNRFYLGDGLYVQHDGFQFILSAPREGGDHFVALEPDVLTTFLGYVERMCNVKITVEKLDDTKE